MTQMSIEMLTPERVTELWPVLEPHFEAACQGNEIAKDELDAKDIYVLAMTGLVAIFVGFENDEPACVMGIQFTNTNGHKGADVMALAGRGLMRFKRAYWRSIIEWLKANGPQYDSIECTCCQYIGGGGFHIGKESPGADSRDTCHQQQDDCQT